MTAAKKISDAQAAALSRLVRGVTNSVSPDMGRSLVKAGLAYKFDVYEEKEWNKVVRRLWIMTVLEAGKAAYEAAKAEGRCN